MNLADLSDLLQKDATDKGYNDYEGDGYNNPYQAGTEQWGWYQDGWDNAHREFAQKWPQLQPAVAIVTPDEIVRAIDKELQWCFDNPDKAFSEEYRKGFTNGLIQVKYLIGEMVAFTAKEPPLPRNKRKRSNE
jgi:hypothetical protein